jgi:acetylglutamate kinase
MTIQYDDGDIIFCNKVRDSEIIAIDKLIIQQKKDQHEGLKKAEILAEALPYMKKFAGEIFIINYNGSESEEDLKNFAADAILLKQLGINPIIVHSEIGQVNKMLAKLNIKPSFVEGVRVTDSDTIEVIEMVLSGLINKNIVKAINNAGGNAIGISGKDGNLIAAKKLTHTKRSHNSNIEQIINFGFIGQIYRINIDFLSAFEDSDIIPVIAPIGVGDNGETFIIDADEVANKIASNLSAAKLVIIDNFDGIILPGQELVSHLNINTAKKMISDGLIKNEIISKVENCIIALQNNVESAHIINIKTKHGLLTEILTRDGVGTMIT